MRNKSQPSAVRFGEKEVKALRKRKEEAVTGWEPPHYFS